MVPQIEKKPSQKRRHLDICWYQYPYFLAFYHLKRPLAPGTRLHLWLSPKASIKYMWRLQIGNTVLVEGGQGAMWLHGLKAPGLSNSDIPTEYFNGIRILHWSITLDLSIRIFYWDIPLEYTDGVFRWNTPLKFGCPCFLILLVYAYISNTCSNPIALERII